MTSRYTYRNLPCTNCAWYVSGTDRATGASGILEWCKSEKDAIERMAKMTRDYRFVDLKVCQDPDPLMLAEDV